MRVKHGDVTVEKLEDNRKGNKRGRVRVLRELRHAI